MLSKVLEVTVITWTKLVQVAKRLILTFSKLTNWLRSIAQNYQQWLVTFFTFTVSEREIEKERMRGERERERERVNSSKVSLVSPNFFIFQLFHPGLLSKKEY